MSKDYFLSFELPTGLLPKKKEEQDRIIGKFLRTLIEAGGPDAYWLFYRNPEGDLVCDSQGIFFSMDEIDFIIETLAEEGFSGIAVWTWFNVKTEEQWSDIIL